MQSTPELTKYISQFMDWLKTFDMNEYSMEIHVGDDFECYECGGKRWSKHDQRCVDCRAYAGAFSGTALQCIHDYPAAWKHLFVIANYPSVTIKELSDVLDGQHDKETARRYLRLSRDGLSRAFRPPENFKVIYGPEVQSKRRKGAKAHMEAYIALHSLTEWMPDNALMYRKVKYGTLENGPLKYMVDKFLFLVALLLHAPPKKDS